MQTKEQDFTFDVENAQSTDQQFNLLGVAYNGIQLNHPGGAHVTVPESSINQVQTDNISGSFLIKSMKITVSDVDQLREPFYIVHKTMSGEVERLPLNLTNFRNPMYKDQTLIVLDKSTGFQPIKITGEVGFEGVIKAATPADDPHGIVAHPTTMEILVTFQYIAHNNYRHFVEHAKVEKMLSRFLKKAA